MANPVISVVIPVYNAERYLDEAIASIASQSFTNWELIIVDDCSSDESYRIMSAWAVRDARIKIFHNESNLKVAQSRNSGISQISPSSRYIATMDADDRAHPDRLEKQFEFMELNPEYSVCGSSIGIMDENGRVFAIRNYPVSPDKILKLFCRYNPLAHPTTLIRRSMLGNMRYDPEHICDDYDLFFRLAAKYPVDNLTECLVDYRLSTTQIKAKYLKRSLGDSIAIQSKYLFLSRFFSLLNYPSFLAQCILYICPGKLVFGLFKMKYYRINKKISNNVTI